MTTVSKQGSYLTDHSESTLITLAIVNPLLSIAACAIGGVSLLGGVGRVQNVVLGAFFIILIQNGMNLMRVGSYLQMVVIGVLLIVAISAEYFRQQMLSTLKK